MKTKLVAAVLGILVVLTALAAGRAPSPKWTCTLTGQAVEKCCCIQQKDGKLYCTLAKKTVDPCCCKAATK